MPSPYCFLPQIPFGNLPLVVLLQFWQHLISASKCSTVFSNTISILVLRSIPSHLAFSKDSPQVSQLITGNEIFVVTVLALFAQRELSFFPLDFEPSEVLSVPV